MHNAAPIGRLVNAAAEQPGFAEKTSPVYLRFRNGHTVPKSVAAIHRRLAAIGFPAILRDTHNNLLRIPALRDAAQHVKFAACKSTE
jgi:hypothetical protein